MYVQKYEKMKSKGIKKRTAINAHINERNMHKTSPLIHVTQLQHQRSRKKREKTATKNTNINQ